MKEYRHKNWQKIQDAIESDYGREDRATITRELTLEEWEAEQDLREQRLKEKAEAQKDEKPSWRKPPANDAKAKSINVRQTADRRARYVTAGRAGSQAVFISNDNSMSQARRAVEVARQTKGYARTTNRIKGAVNTYRLKLADLTSKSSSHTVANHYRKQTAAAMECDRKIRAYMLKQGFSKKTVNKAMLFASPALYGKSLEEAKQYTRKFDRYIRDQKREEVRQKRQEKRAQKYNKGRRL